MMNDSKLFPLLCGFLLLLPSITFAKDKPHQTKQISSPTPWLDDADLNAVQFVGTKTGWAVGDRGTIWKTIDGGNHWTLQPAPVKSSLKSLCFLTDKVGWIAGGSTEEFTQLSKGVLLFTSDGGKTWQQPTNMPLPTLYKIKFFTLKHGIAVGAASVKQNSSVYTTSDGGKTWEVIPGEQTSQWRVADFMTSKNGIVAGRQGEIAIVGNGRVLKSNIPGMGRRGLKGVKLNRDFSGWLVGDGGLLLKTKNGGVAWGPLFSKSLPYSVRKIFDFQTVTTYKKHVWVAGQPGSIIWHSADDGLHWQPQKTKQSLPIKSLHFANEQQGWGVGAMGLILKTVDGGKIWKGIKGNGRRAAWMGIYTRPQNLSCSLITQLSGEEGYRSVLLLPMRNKAESESQKNADLDQQWHDAVLRAGGNTGSIGWEFDLSLPEIEQHKAKLIAELQRKNEGEFGQKFIERLVRQIRTWRPSIILLHYQDDKNELDHLLVQAVTKAVQDAADPTQFLLHREIAALSFWKVQHIYLRGRDGHRGSLLVDPSRYLPHLHATNQTIAQPAYGMLAPLRKQTSLREVYAPVSIQNKKTQTVSQNFFAGIFLSQGSSARRMLLPIKRDDLEKQLKLAQKQRNFQGYVERYLDKPKQAAQIISQLNNITRGMSDEQAALQLAQLGNDYLQRNRWELAEATFINLVERYPKQPVTANAMRWLVQFWGSAEATWQRVRSVSVSKKQLASNLDALRERIRRATEHSKKTPLQRLPFDPNASPDPVSIIQQTGGVNGNDGRGLRVHQSKYWQGQAIQLASLMRRTSPQLFETPGVQFSLASLMRQRGNINLSDRYMMHLQNSGKETRWKKMADGEMWLRTFHGEPPQKNVQCKRTKKRPKLDGILSDSCWEDAIAINLSSQKKRDAKNSINRKKQTFTMLSYDGDFLYFAASVPKHSQLTYKKIKEGGRTHDADMRGHDRIRLKIDTDRDYATCYELNIDQRGWTAEKCFGNKKWNPKWYVATKEDATSWRIEAAIPLSELTATPPGRGTVWGVSITRVLPAVGFESWTEKTKSGAETFGHLQFR
ncbi:hypothetical protein MNBD_PLANCTO02-1213 [hydrothermal vent metagenome]|uniref:Photosynthesis system II assembly factor Ycf48/Hcf136-like domain-containing protein n=1 Tax=hydrothermal vent metagenome TaxID=652676 RepID=A0A3B1DQZ5_9ZZZZ